MRPGITGDVLMRVEEAGRDDATACIELVDAGKPVAQKKVHFRPVQPHALCATVAGSGDIGEQPGIDVQIQPVTIQRFRRQIAQMLEAA